MAFKEQLEVYSGIVNNALEEYLNHHNGYEAKIYESMRYSIRAGGKRLRPVLALAVADMFGKPHGDVLPFACAIEMIHTYSLIHDDLPAMDNDDFRRGKPTNHKVFGEAMAILAGDALLNMAFETMLEAADTPARNEAAKYIAKAAGTLGMIGGQVIDIQSEGEEIPPEKLRALHSMKTGALIKAPVVSAAVICGANSAHVALLDTFAGCLGMAFQIKDDILDVESSAAVLGKSIGKDAASGKATFVTIFGLDTARQLLAQETHRAIESLAPFGVQALFLKNLAEYLLYRDH